MSNGLNYFEKKGFVGMEEFQTFFVQVLTVRNLCKLRMMKKNTCSDPVTETL